VISEFQAQCLKAQEILSECEGSIIEKISSSAVNDRSSFEFTLVRTDSTFGEVTVALESVRHLSVGNQVAIESAFADQLSVIHLPASGNPWPEEAERLVTRFANLPELVWVRLVGPVEVDVVAQILTISRAVDLSARDSGADPGT
jgi:hypothetical protein